MAIIREYDKIKAINNSKLKYFKRSPEHFQHILNFPEPRKDHFAFGVAFHIYVLEPQKFKNEVLVFDPDLRPEPEKTFGSNQNKAWKEDIYSRAEKDGVEIITKDEYDTIQKMAEKLYSNHQAREIVEFSRNKFEVLQKWNWKKTKCKALIDIKNEIFLADLKTTQNADPDKFRKDFFNHEMYRQCGMYLDGDAKGKINFNNMKDFYFIAIEKTPPFGIAIFQPNVETIIHGVEEYRELVERYQECKDRDKWGGYETKSLLGTPFEISLPYYLMNHEKV